MKRAILMLMILLLPFVSAEIILNQPHSHYNLGDSIDITATLHYSQDLTSSLSLMLSCENGVGNFYNSPISLSANKEKVVGVSLPLTEDFIGDLLGNCKITAVFKDMGAETQEFEVSNVIDVSINIDKKSIDAGETITISGDAIKRNNNAAIGFFEIGVEDTSINTKGIVKNGSFGLDLMTPFDLRSGNYVVEVRVYEEKGGVITNEGYDSIGFKVRQKPTKIDIMLEYQEIDPGNDILFRAEVFDQAGENIEASVISRIKNPDGKSVFEKVISTDETQNYYLETNSSYGYWEIEAEGLDLAGRRLIYVNELAKINTILENETLIIENIGNVPYKKPLEIMIGEESKIIEVSLGLNEFKKYQLQAPDGMYDIGLREDNESYEMGGVALTGSSIGVKEIKGRLKIKYSVFWLFLIVIMLTVAILVFDRMRDKSISFASPTGSVRVVSDMGVKRIKPSEITVQKQDTRNVRDAEHTLVTKGNKEEATFLVLRIKKDKDKFPKSLVEKISEKARETGAAVYKQEDHVFVFAPTLTKTFKNVAKAAKFGEWIKQTLKDEFEFGIGVNTGNIIASVQDNKLKFTSLGNSLNIAKKIAGNANNEMLLDKESVSSGGNEIKARKEKDFYVVERIVDGERNQKFIKDFLKRVKAENGAKKQNPQ